MKPGIIKRIRGEKIFFFNKSESPKGICIWIAVQGSISRFFFLEILALSFDVDIESYNCTTDLSEETSVLQELEWLTSGKYFFFLIDIVF